MKKIKHRANHKFLILSISLFAIAMIFSFILCFLLTPNIELESRELTFSYDEEVILPEYHAYFLGKKIDSKVKIKKLPQNPKLGKYWVEYQVKYFLFPVKKLVLIEIVDQKPPEIELVGNHQVSLCPNEEYQEEGFSAIDSYDGDLTKEVEVEKNKDKIIYRVKDSSMNKAEVVRNLSHEDHESPILTLKGPEKVYVYVNNTYQELGYEVTDNCDKEMKDKVQVNGTVDSSKVGTYKITYKATDASGNTAQKERTVEVISRKQNGEGKGVIYLTFDDGPSNSSTPKILKILKQENVKATFFVIHHEASLQRFIHQEHQEGHTVALHSYTHNYGRVYQSSTNYFDDLNKIRNEVFQLTGEYSNIIRFPGGSSNTVSKKYKVGIMQELSSEVLKRGYHYFDWNVDSNDGAGEKNPDKIYWNVINGLSKQRENVVLMHDFENNTGTLQALPRIIQYGKENGYQFKQITMETNMVHHRVHN